MCSSRIRKWLAPGVCVRVRMKGDSGRARCGGLGGTVDNLNFHAYKRTRHKYFNKCPSKVSGVVWHSISTRLLASNPSEDLIKKPGTKPAACSVSSTTVRMKVEIYLSAKMRFSSLFVQSAPLSGSSAIRCYATLALVRRDFP